MIALVSVLAGLMVGWVWLYAVVSWNGRVISRQLPEEPRELAQQLWNLSHRRRWVVSAAVLPALGCFGLSAVAMLRKAEHSNGWARASVPIYMVWILGCLVAERAGGYHLDRHIRQTTWSARDSVRFRMGGLLLMGSGSIALFMAMEVLRQLELVLPATWDWTTTVLGMVVGAWWLMNGLLRRICATLLRLKPCNEPQVHELIREFSCRNGAPPLYIAEMPERGGSTPFAAVWGETLLITSFLRQQLTNQELQAILAHEVGHHLMKDLRRRQVDYLVCGLIGILLACILPRVFYHESIAFPFAGFGFTVDMLPLLPYLLTSRWRRRRWHAQELRADRIGAEMLGNRQLMAHALQKVHTLAFQPDAFPKGVKVSHPSLDARIQCLLENLPSRDEFCARPGDEEGAPATGETKGLK